MKAFDPSQFDIASDPLFYDITLEEGFEVPSFIPRFHIERGEYPFSYIINLALTHDLRILKDSISWYLGGVLPNLPLLPPGVNLFQPLMMSVRYTISQYRR